MFVKSLFSLIVILPILIVLYTKNTSSKNTSLSPQTIILFSFILFFFFPIFIDKVLMNTFVTNWHLSEWAGFLGSYLGGGIGGAMALYGIHYQLTHSKKVEKNDNFEILKKIYSFSFIQINLSPYFNQYNFLFLNNNIQFEKTDFFGKNFIEKYEKEIISLDFYEDIILFNLKIENFTNKIKEFYLLKEELNILIKKIKNENNSPNFEKILSKINDFENSSSQQITFDKISSELIPYTSLILDLFKEIITLEVANIKTNISIEAEKIKDSTSINSNPNLRKLLSEKTINDTSSVGKMEINTLAKLHSRYSNFLSFLIKESSIIKADNTTLKIKFDDYCQKKQSKTN